MHGILLTYLLFSYCIYFTSKYTLKSFQFLMRLWINCPWILCENRVYNKKSVTEMLRAEPMLWVSQWTSKETEYIKSFLNIQNTIWIWLKDIIALSWEINFQAYLLPIFVLHLCNDSFNLVICKNFLPLLCNIDPWKHSGWVKYSVGAVTYNDSRRFKGPLGLNS